MIDKKDNLKEVVDNFPEVSPILVKFGLHCASCHVSAMESIEDGCKAHSLNAKEIDNLIKEANEQIKKFDSLPDFDFTKKAFSKLKQKLNESNNKYIRIFPIFGGFDFNTTNKKFSDEIILEKGFKIVINEKVRRFLKGVKIDFDEKQNDFSAKRID
ncbi:MAG: DUF1858 domain-containing protein [Candidatus ainarchaeum sp.]|nr:DUF1858 domain-containing protein [Candidatus ainarchaeum sp.]